MRKRVSKSTKKATRVKIQLKRQKSITSPNMLLMALITLLTTSPSAAIQKHTFTAQRIGGSGSSAMEVCKDDDTNIIPFWFKSGITFALNIAGASTTANQYINDDSSVKQYTRLQRGTDSCHVPDPSYTGWIFLALIIEKHPTIADTCVVTSVITTSYLTTCPGSPPTALEQAPISFSIGNYDAVGKRARVSWDDAYLTENVGEFAVIELTTTFALSSIDDDFVEFLVLLHNSDNKESYFNTFKVSEFNYMRQAYHIKSGKILSPKTFAERQLVDGLRGYSLIPDPSNDFGVFRDVLFFSKDEYLTKSLLFHFYLSKPWEMTNQDVLILKITTEPLKLNDPDYTLKSFEYHLKIIRNTGSNQFEFTLTRIISSTPSGQTTLNMPYTGGNQDWVHFGVSLGYGMLYSTGATTGKFKRTEAVHAWFNSNECHSEMTYLENEQTKSLFSGTLSGRMDTLASVEMEAFSDSSMTTKVFTNNFGLRVWEAKWRLGSYLGYQISNAVVSDGRCFLRGIFDDNCLMYAFLKSTTDTNTNSIHNNLLKPSENCPISRCKFCMHKSVCMFAPDGQNEDIYFSDKMPFSYENWDSAIYDPNKSTQSGQFVKVVNNQGKDYWIRCPINCKRCDENLECLECHGDVPLTTLQVGYRYNFCPCSVSRCEACETATKCKICGSGRIPIQTGGDPNVNSCETQASCPNEYGFPDVFKAGCVACPFQGCKTCDLGIADGGCTECTSVGFKAIDYSQSDFLGPGDPNYGEKKCIDATTVVDGFYKDGNYYKKCLENCKTCSDGMTCSVCGSPAGSSATFYLISTESPHRCTDCLKVNNEYLTEESSVNCVACPAGQRLMKGGTSTSNCDACDTNNGKFVDNSGYCDNCLSDCSQCSDKTGCTKCQDSTKNVQPDGTCSQGCPKNHIVDRNKVCKPLICTIPSCEECSADQVCSVCQQGTEVANNQCQTATLNSLKKNRIPIKFVLTQQYPTTGSSEFEFLIRIDTSQFTKDQINLVKSSILNLSPTLLSIRLWGIEPSSVTNTEKEAKTQSFGISSSEIVIENTREASENLVLRFNNSRPTSEASPTKVTSMHFSHGFISLTSDASSEYILEAKSERYEIRDDSETTKKTKPLSEGYKTIARNTKTVNDNTESATLATSVIFSAFSVDPSWSMLKFNHFLSMVKILNLIGGWFGVNLTSFLEYLTVDREANSSNNQKIQEIRVSQNSEERPKNRILQELIQKKRNPESRFYKYKLDNYGTGIRLEGVFLYKVIAYLVLWVAKIISILIFRSMEVDVSSFKKWKIYAVVYIRKIHFSTVGAVSMNVLFFGSRIILHSENTTKGIVSKLVCGLSMTLLMVDLIEIFLAGWSLRPPEDFTNGETDPKKKNKPLEKNSMNSTKQSIMPKREERSEPTEDLKNSSQEKFRGGEISKTKNRKLKRLLKKGSNFRQSMEKRWYRRHQLSSQSGSSSPLKRFLSDDNSDRKSSPTTKNIQSASIFKKTKKNKEKIEKMKIIDIPKTIEYNKTNQAINLFFVSVLIRSELAYSSKICSLNNWFSFIHMGLYQFLIPALPLLPRFVLTFLIIIELGCLLLTILPYLMVTRFLGWFQLFSKVVRFLFLEGFLICCIILCWESRNELKPLSESVQDLAILLVVMGLVAEYMLFMTQLLLIIIKVLKGIFGKKKSKEGCIKYKEADGEGANFCDLDFGRAGTGWGALERPENELRKNEGPRRTFVQGPLLGGRKSKNSSIAPIQNRLGSGKLSSGGILPKSSKGSSISKNDFESISEPSPEEREESFGQIINYFDEIDNQRQGEAGVEKKGKKQKKQKKFKKKKKQKIKPLKESRSQLSNQSRKKVTKAPKILSKEKKDSLRNKSKKMNFGYSNRESLSRKSDSPSKQLLNYY